MCWASRRARLGPLGAWAPGLLGQPFQRQHHAVGAPLMGRGAGCHPFTSACGTRPQQRHRPATRRAAGRRSPVVCRGPHWRSVLHGNVHGLAGLRVRHRHTRTLSVLFQRTPRSAPYWHQCAELSPLGAAKQRRDRHHDARRNNLYPHGVVIPLPPQIRQVLRGPSVERCVQSSTA